MSRLIDMTGQQFGEWTVLRRVENASGGVVTWECKCSCGTISEVRAGNLRSGVSRRCVKCKPNIGLVKANEAQYVDYTGLESGRLTVLSNSDRKNKKRQSYVWAECSCNGGIKEYLAFDLTTGHTKSCGCLYLEVSIAKMKAHNALRSLPA